MISSKEIHTCTTSLVDAGVKMSFLYSHFHEIGLLGFEVRSQAHFFYFFAKSKKNILSYFIL